MTDDRIVVEADADRGGPNRIVLAVAVVAVLGFILFLGQADFSQPDAEPDSVPTTTVETPPNQETTTTTTPALEAGLRSLEATVDGRDIDWTPVALPDSMTSVADIGTFQGETVMVGGRSERGYFHDLSLSGLSTFGSWFDIGRVTDERLAPVVVEITERAIVIAARSFPTAESPLGQNVILHSTDGVAWIESRFDDPGVHTMFLSAAVERDAIWVYAAEISSDVQTAIESLPADYQQLIQEQLAFPVGFDGDIIVYGPLGMEIGRFESDLVPAREEISEELTFAPVSWSGPLDAPLEQVPSPFGEGFVDAVRTDTLGDLVAQVFNGETYDEWTSTGNGEWSLVASGVRAFGRAEGGLGSASLYLEQSSVTPRLMLVEERVSYRIDFEQPALRLLGVHSAPFGVVVWADTFGNVQSDPPQDVTYVDGPWTITLDQTGLLRAESTDGARISRLVSGVWPVEFDRQNRTITVPNLTGDGSDAVLDMMLLLDAEERLNAQLPWAHVLVSRDLENWAIGLMDRSGAVSAAAVTPDVTYVVITTIDENQRPLDVLFATEN